MTRYTAKNPELTFNMPRHKAYLSFQKTMDDLFGKAGVTEQMFKNRWFELMEAEGEVFADGWYCPPPKGIAVLFGDRVTFDSLRNEQFWSGDTVIDWNKDMFYAYASPVCRKTGVIGDTSVTICFGKNQKMIDHVKKSHDAVMDVFESLSTCETGGDLFRMSQEIFAKHHLKSTVISRTDASPVNLGHTFPTLENISEISVLTDDDKSKISKARKFVNEVAEWKFEEGLQFTVEPQLVSTDDEEMPKITQHYLVKAGNGEFTVCNDIDIILERFGMI